MTRVFFFSFIAAVALVALYVAVKALYRMVSAYLKFRGTRVVVCPETREYAAVEVDAGHAATTTARAGHAELKLYQCTRWPEHAGCAQECLGQIERAPGDCLVRTMLTEWYEGKSCAFCGKPIGEINWVEHKPALLSPDHRLIDWKAVPPEKVPGALATHRAVCWNCYIAESFRAEHPELVVDRDRRVA